MVYSTQTHAPEAAMTKPRPAVVAITLATIALGVITTNFVANSNVAQFFKSIDSTPVAAR